MEEGHKNWTVRFLNLAEYCTAPSINSSLVYYLLCGFMHITSQLQPVKQESAVRVQGGQLLGNSRLHPHRSFLHPIT